MKILFYLGHPAHFHLFKHAINHFKNNAVVVIKSKDILQKLLNENNVPFINVEEINSKHNAGGKFLLAFRILKRIFGIQRIIRNTKPDLLAGSPAELALAGKITGVPVCMFFEDDINKVAPYGSLTGPFAFRMVCPDVCNAGRWSDKKVGYNSYHELAYLHPNHFTPDKSKVAGYFKEGEKNFIIRFVELGAFHDAGKKGITNEFAGAIIKKLSPFGKIHITSERALPKEFEPFRIHISPSDIHHALYFSDMFIGDSQTMTAEAAVLGTPALRFNDFVGELSYLEDLEHRHELTFGFKTNNAEGLLEKLDELIQTPELKQTWKIRKEKMLLEKTDLAKWMINFFENFPVSDKTY